MKFQSNRFHFNGFHFNGSCKDPYKNELLELPVGRVFQVSELHLPSGGKIARHKQWCDEITYVFSGSATVVSGKKKEIMRKGDVHYIKEGVDHKIIVDKNEGFRYMCVGLFSNDEEEVNKLLKKEMKDEDSFFVRDDGDINLLSQLLIGEFYAWDDFSLQSVNAYINQILLILCRLLKGEKGSVKGELVKDNSANHTVYKIIRYIDTEYINLDSIKSVADAMNYSENYISHLFVEKMGIRIKTYLMTKKITYAIELLKTTKMSIEEISEYLNFSSAQTFRRVFKQYAGKTPTEIREENDKV